MSLSAAQTFVETDDLAAVEEVVAQALAEWAAGVGELPADEDGPTLLERHVVLVPPHEGYVTVIETSGRVDRALARNLRTRLAVRTCAAELDGHFLTASLEVNEPDGESAEWSCPDLPRDPDAMPAYVDAEAELYARLVAHGVPTELIASDWEEMLDPTSPEAEGARITAEAGIEGLIRTSLPFGAIRELAHLPGPRVRPDLWVAEPDGEARVVEARRPTGAWNVVSVRALAAVEEAQASRIVAALAWTAETDLLPKIAFTYEGVDDEDGFLSALAEARAHRPLLVACLRGGWLSIRGLVRAIEAIVRQSHPAFAIGHPCGDRLELRHASAPHASLLLDLATTWQGYFAAPDQLEAILAEALPRLLDRAREAPDFEENRLFPMLLSREASGIERLAVRPFADGVHVALGVDTGDALVPLTREALRTSGLGFEDALEHAVARMDVLTEENDEFVLYEQPEGLTLVAEFPDPESAARILSPAVLGHVAQQLGDGCLVAVPNRDALLAAENTPEARRWLEREVARRYLVAERPLTAMLWTIENGELEEAGTADLSRASDPDPER